MIVLYKQHNTINPKYQENLSKLISSRKQDTEKLGQFAEHVCIELFDALIYRQNLDIKHKVKINESETKEQQLEVEPLQQQLCQQEQYKIALNAKLLKVQEKIDELELQKLTPNTWVQKFRKQDKTQINSGSNILSR